MKTTSTLLFVLIMLLTGCGNVGKRQTESSHADTVTLQADTVMLQKETVADTILADTARHDSAEVSIPVIVPYCNDIPTGKEISHALLSMCTEYDYYPLPTNEITVFVTNKSGGEYTCGDEYSIAYYNEKDKTWEPLPVNPISEDMLWIILPYHNVRMQTIHIYTDIVSNRPGKYRIYKPFNNHTEVAFAEFEMVYNKGVRKLMDSMWKKVTSLPRTDTIRKNISTACQLHDSNTISVGLINNNMPYQEMFRKRILNYSALDFGKITPTQPLPFTTTSDTMDISMRTEKPVFPVGTEEIPVKIYNNNDRMLFFGLDYGIARKEGDEWLVLNTSTVWNSVGILIQKGRDYNFKAHMYNLVNDNKPGTYKVYKRIGFDGTRKEWYMSAEFKLE
ncbi:immunoglobulin-like domain-containing protein [Bacteroides caecigallinarum]|uniref:immunoglobulin-like domain-containing protein n=1 Tax=Bacteroides caecigallinarum TaxID=1411144 RepID=UPI001EF441E8|nr:immunoglobulin-like domain-containing protein [Bacteroides caecigallinarum]